MSEPPFKVSTPAKTQIARAFGLKAHHYEANAIIQKELLSRLDFEVIKDFPEKIWVDLGCGIGILEKILRQKGYCSRFVGLDIAFESLQVLKSRNLQNIFNLAGDIENLPFKSGCFDGAVLASVLQWFNNPSTVLKNISDILKNDGMLLFAAFVEGSFIELNTLKKELGLQIPVLLPDSKVLCNLIENECFTITKTGIFTSTLYFPSAFELLKSISAIGGTAVSGNRLSRSDLLEFCKKFEQKYQCDKGIPISYKAVFGSARKG